MHNTHRLCLMGTANISDVHDSTDTNQTRVFETLSEPKFARGGAGCRCCPPPTLEVGRGATQPGAVGRRKLEGIAILNLGISAKCTANGARWDDDPLLFDYNTNTAYLWSGQHAGLAQLEL